MIMVLIFNQDKKIKIEPMPKLLFAFQQALNAEE